MSYRVFLKATKKLECNETLKKYICQVIKENIS